MSARARRPARAGRLVAALLLASISGGCAYYNGVYNARAAARRGDRALAAGRDSSAAASFALSAQKAETVLVRYPHSRWVAEARYLAARGLAYAGLCDRAVPRLRAYLDAGARDSAHTERAALALATCLARSGAAVDALALLDPLTRSRDELVARQARLWGGRLAVALGRGDDARRYLAGVDAAVAERELARDALEREDYAAAESLLVRRAVRGDYDDAVPGAVRALWRAGRGDGARRVVERYDGSRAPVAAKTTLHLALADLLADAGQDSLARAQLLRARRLAPDSLAERAVQARLTRLALHDVSSLDDADALVRRSSQAGAGDPMQQRLERGILLARLLSVGADTIGAGAFLAAEIARDSLRAPALARALFARVPAEWPRSPLAPRALLAAAALAPDSAAAYRDRVRRFYAGSPEVLTLDGGDAATAPGYARTDSLLLDTWSAASRALADTLARRSPVAAAAPPAGGTSPVP